MSFLMIFAKRFIAGEKAEEAISAVKKLNAKNIATTVDILGENVKSKEDAIKAADAYISLLELINKNSLNSNVSLKLTQMGLDISDDFCKGNLERILEKAKECRNFVRIDMEGSAYTQRTLDLFKELHKKYDNLGVVIQTCLYRSSADIEDLIKMKAGVRLCKGAYKEPPSIAFKNKKDVNKNYVELMERLLLEGNYPAIATHDDKIIDYAKLFAFHTYVNAKSFEFQMLYGIRRKLQERLAEAGYNVRVYVPFGTHWLPYTVRRLRERKENIIFVLKNLFRD